MQDLNDMMMFAQVVEARGFSEAARRTGASKSRVSKSVTRLERALGVRLLNRSTRALSLTELGASFYEHCVQIANEAALAAESVTRLQSEPRGVLKITAPVAFGRLHVAPACADYLARYPGLKLDVSITDRVVDLVGEGYDVAVRIATEPALQLVARELAPVRRVICATPGYFKRRGIPRSPHELADHNCLYYTRVGPRAEWRLHGARGELVVPVKGSLRIDDDDALSQAVLAGLGVAVLPTFIIGRELRSGQLQTVLPDYIPPERRIFAVHLPNVHLPIKIRGFINFLQARFGPVPYWDQIDADWPEPRDPRK